jgi:hypothetical protein
MAAKQPMRNWYTPDFMFLMMLEEEKKSKGSCEVKIFYDCSPCPTLRLNTNCRR